MTCQRLAYGLLALTFVVCRPATGAEPLAEVDAYAAKAMADWQVPGMAIAVVKDDQVLLAKGYGVRKLGEDQPVDSQTLFAIGSTSKAFTAAVLAILIDEQKLAWDDAAIRHLPNLVFYDPYVTRELTVRDLLCHRSGLARADMLWFGSAYSRDEVLRRLRYLKPSWSFRSHFGYQNIMYLAAGQLAAQVAGQSWDDQIKQRLFLPLGMKSSVTSTNDLAARDNVATPHAKIDDQVQAIAYRNIDNVAPAGSINSCVDDMCQWLRLQLGQGVYAGNRLLSEAAIAEMQAAQMTTPLDDEMRQKYPDAHLMAYGLGWFLHDYHGRKIVEHGGHIDGMSAQVMLAPEEKLGVVVLMNSGGSMLPRAMAFYLVDQLLGTSSRDWSAYELEQFQKQEAKDKAEKAKQEAERKTDTKPSLPLPDYAGAYTDELYGDAVVTCEQDKLVLARGPAFVADLSHWHYDTFLARFRDRSIEPALVTFSLGADGRVSMLEWPTLGQYQRQPAK